MNSYYAGFLKKAIFLHISFGGKAFAEIPPFPPLKKGGDLKKAI
jgi:hypothetical protein